MTNVFCMKKILELFAVLVEGEIAMSEKFLDFIIKIEPNRAPTKNAGEIRKWTFGIYSRNFSDINSKFFLVGSEE